MSKKIAFGIAILFIAAILTSCVSEIPQPTETFPIPEPVISVSENWDYITFSRLYGYIDEGNNKEIIGNAILQWENANPGRTIVDLDIIYNQHAYMTSPEIKGISIYSELK